MELEDITLPVVADIVKDTKVGQGLNFLPRTLSALTKKLHLLLTSDSVDTKLSSVKREVAGILDELLRRGDISLKRYQHIKDEHNIL